MKIDPIPHRPPAYSPNDSRYWDARDLEVEARRSFEVCHNCRMCVNYCGSFPELFKRVDRDIESRGAEGAELLDAADFRAVTEACWQCKLCYIKCPYTPDEGHEWSLDIPRLLMREKAQRAAREGVSLQDRVLGEPGMLGALGSGPFASIANIVNANRLVRKATAATLGISEHFPLPPFAPQTFDRWLDHHTPLAEAGTIGEVAIFSTCLGDFHFPWMPANAVRVLEKNGYRVRRPEQVCCGIPNLDGGDVDAARAKAAFNVASLKREIDAGRSIVVPGPTCSYTIRKEYPELLGTEDARIVASRTFDVMEFLDGLRKGGTLSKDFARGLGKVAYHAACHLRAQKIGFPGTRLLSLAPETEVETVQHCSAVDGTWGMKAQHYESGRHYAKKLTRGMEEADAAVFVTDCMLSAQRIQKENGVAVVHPVQALALAYGVAVGPE
jgi:glycerol-3-phosphate dehydrogenase subunit C